MIVVGVARDESQEVNAWLYVQIELGACAGFAILRERRVLQIKVEHFLRAIDVVAIPVEKRRNEREAFLVHPVCFVEVQLRDIQIGENIELLSAVWFFLYASLQIDRQIVLHALRK